MAQTTISSRTGELTPGHMLCARAAVNKAKAHELVPGQHLQVKAWHSAATLRYISARYLICHGAASIELGQFQLVTEVG